ncbi:PAS domain S-box protein [Gallionella capsiferriformans]|nr:PAS domain S-box protein [Gallionella capsiferriformans]
MNVPYMTNSLRLFSLDKCFVMKADDNKTAEQAMHTTGTNVRKVLTYFVMFFHLLFLVNTVAHASSETQDITSQTPTQVTQLHKATLIVGSEQDYPPFATGMTDATAGGFTVDLWKAVADEARLNYTIRVLPFHQLLQEFKDGKIDVLINLAQSEQRRHFADFTVPHVIMHGAIFVRRGKNSIHTEDDLHGKSIIVLRADLGHDYAVSKGWMNNLVLVDSPVEGFKLLASGKHDAMLLAKLTGIQTLNSLGLDTVQPLKIKIGFSQKFSFAVAKGQSDLLGKINEGLALTKSNRTYDALYEKWFSAYEERAISRSDILLYLTPVFAFFLLMAIYVYYRRKVEREMAGAALAEAKKLLATIIDTAPIRIFWKDKHLKYLGCNAIFSKDAGAESPNEVIGKDDYQMVWRAQAAEYRQDDLAVIASGQTKLFYEEQQTTPAGEVIWLHTSKVPLKNSSGEIIGILGVYEDITEKKHTEEQMQFLLLEQKAMLENDLVGIVRVQDRVITWANPSFEHMLGYGKGELNGKPTRICYINDKAYHDLGEAAYPALKSGKVYRTQLEHACKDGRVIWVDISGTTLNATTGESLWAFLDITERKQVETALQNSNQQLNLLLDSMAEGTYGVDTNENCIFVNHSFLKILGYQSQDEVVGKNIHELIHHSHADGTPYPASECRIYASNLRNENLHCDDEVFWHRLGVPIPVEYWSRPIINDGVLIGCIVTFIDISERKEAEEKLRYSEQRFHDVSDAAGEYLWELDANMIYTYVSTRAIDVKGYTPEELLGKSPMAFMPEEDIENVGNIINRAITSRGPFKLEHRDITKSGALVWEEVNGLPIYDKNGEVIGLRGTGLNISERKEMEERVHQLAFYDPLTSLPNRRLLNDRLSQAMSAGERSGLYGALMFLDLDNFKPLNDTHGHGVGDLLLIEAASRLKKCVRGMDTVARFGGDEFVVMLSELDAGKSDATVQARLVAEKILAALSEPYVLKISTSDEFSSVEHHCTASIGVTVFLNHVTRQDDILKQADDAMYVAKGAGRNSIRFHEEFKS